MNIYFRITSYLRHLLFAGDEHSIHSPFLFNFYLTCIKSQANYYCFSEIEALRNDLLSDNSAIEVYDLGAGSGILKNPRRQISSIANTSLKSAKTGQILFRIAREQKPKVILEFGTSLGLTTAYLAKVDSKAEIISFEGCPALSGIAKKNLERLAIDNVKIITGNLNETLEEELRNHEKVDLVFFDANHRYKPTMHYFNLAIRKVHPHSIFIVDDIYWSPEMYKAWKDICAHSEATFTIDLFHFGLVFFKANAPKQHFRLKL